MCDSKGNFQKKNEIWKTRQKTENFFIWLPEKSNELSFVCEDGKWRKTGTAQATGTLIWRNLLFVVIEERARRAAIAGTTA